MRYLILTLLLLLLLLLSPSVIYAHSGRTDGSGGHWNHFDGTYHSHSDDWIPALFCLGCCAIWYIVIPLSYLLYQKRYKIIKFLFRKMKALLVFLLVFLLDVIFD